MLITCKRKLCLRWSACGVFWMQKVSRNYDPLISGAPDEPRECTKALLRPHQTPRHFSALLRRQLQRHTEEIQKHGGTRLRLPLTPLRTACASLKVGSGWPRGVASFLSLKGTECFDSNHQQLRKKFHLLTSLTRQQRRDRTQMIRRLLASTGSFILLQCWVGFSVSCGPEPSLLGSATESTTVCVCVCAGVRVWGEERVFKFV